MKTLIILHGWQSSKEKWQKVKENIESDLPGFKPETQLKEPWSLDDYVDWLKDFSQTKEKFFLMGHSFGGRVAIKFALRYPEKLYGLILVSAAGIKKKNSPISKIIPFFSSTFLVFFALLSFTLLFILLFFNNY